METTMEAAAYSAFRQIEAVHDSVLTTLGGCLVYSKTAEKVNQWLKGQGCDTVELDDWQTRPWFQRDMIADEMAWQFEKSVGTPLQGFALALESPSPELVDIGQERSGAGWQYPENFVTTSGFVR